ncbi:hypothetical protein [Mycobacterium sp. Marseille-P9652]|uniref:hypothetical protein n=1 Tax=Mycobacterium sp. Marseille-P9652 TaxID=2654950 RepID=UPI0012E7C9F1|nr:hypothetical protein [Mycobacterium sp. Marseille-P9652]
MMVLAVLAAVLMAAGVGYCCGRRAASTPPSWKRRTSRVALGRLALTLLVLVTARRVRRYFPADAPLLLRGGLARTRSY